jgi:hypothetical protein
LRDIGSARNVSAAAAVGEISDGDGLVAASALLAEALGDLLDAFENMDGVGLRATPALSLERQASLMRQARIADSTASGRDFDPTAYERRSQGDHVFAAQLGDWTNELACFLHIARGSRDRYGFVRDDSEPVSSVVAMLLEASDIVTKLHDHLHLGSDGPGLEEMIEMFHELAYGVHVCSIAAELATLVEGNPLSPWDDEGVVFAWADGYDPTS